MAASSIRYMKCLKPSQTPMFEPSKGGWASRTVARVLGPAKTSAGSTGRGVIDMTSPPSPAKPWPRLAIRAPGALATATMPPQEPRDDGGELGRVLQHGEMAAAAKNAYLRSWQRRRQLAAVARARGDVLRPAQHQRRPLDMREAEPRRAAEQAEELEPPLGPDPLLHARRHQVDRRAAGIRGPPGHQAIAQEAVKSIDAVDEGRPVELLDRVLVEGADADDVLHSPGAVPIEIGEQRGGGEGMSDHREAAERKAAEDDVERAGGRHGPLPPAVAAPWHLHAQGTSPSAQPLSHGGPDRPACRHAVKKDDGVLARAGAKELVDLQPASAHGDRAPGIGARRSLALTLRTSIPADPHQQARGSLAPAAARQHRGSAVTVVGGRALQP